MITYEQAKQLATKAHEGQYRRSKIVHTDSWDYYKLNKEIVHRDGSLIQYVHGDQFRVQEPYINHPLQVASMMSTEYRKILAVLHDVIEDTNYILIEGEAFNDFTYYIAHSEYTDMYEISPSLYKDLTLLTKDPKLTYEQNIRRIKDSGRADAVAVKLADMYCNLADNPSERQKQKYMQALPVLLEAL